MDSYADDVLFYGVVSAQTEAVVEFFLYGVVSAQTEAVVEFFSTRENAETMIREVREDEPVLTEELRVEAIELD
ncbi:MAG: hypothetical protein M3R39_07230 [Actinomycetota bacterium]|nr:hypothetical protein [Actinomycetota bacterium]